MDSLAAGLPGEAHTLAGAADPSKAQKEYSRPIVGIAETIVAYGPQLHVRGEDGVIGRKRCTARAIENCEAARLARCQALKIECETGPVIRRARLDKAVLGGSLKNPASLSGSDDAKPLS